MDEPGDLLRERTGNDRVRQWAFLLAVCTLIGSALIFGITLALFVFWYPVSWQSIMEKHLAAILGIPAAAAMAFAFVIFLRQAEGPVEFEGLGFKFKGASGQVVMWVLCFLAIVLALKVLW